MSQRVRRAARPAIGDNARLPRRSDWILAGLVLIGAVIEAVFSSPGYAAVQVPVAVVVAALLPFRRQQPMGLAIATFTVVLIAALVSRPVGADPGVTAAVELAGVVLTYALFRWANGRQILIGLAVILVLMLATEYTHPDNGGITEALLLTAPWPALGLTALAMRYRASLEQSRVAEARLRERNMIARDLHDTVAHQVSAIAIQAQAAKFVAKKNPEAAIEAVDQIEQTANEAIEEMRRMVGLLRSDNDLARTVTPLDLLDLARPDAVPAVSVVGDTSLDKLPSHIANAIYRVAQEATTNATRHNDSATFVHIELKLTDDLAELRITNDGHPTTRNSGGGWGVVGMSERVEALGGALSSERRPAAGWQVHATIPLEDRR